MKNEFDFLQTKLSQLTTPNSKEFFLKYILELQEKMNEIITQINDLTNEISEIKK